MRIARLLAALCFGFSIPVGIFWFQNKAAPAEVPEPFYPRLFNKPTGDNGYEEFVLAADMAEASSLVQEYEDAYYGHPGPSIAVKRRLIAAPGVQRILSLIRSGLKKRVRSPRPRQELTTTTPELRTFRTLGRLMATEMQTAFADGHNDRAIDCFRDALRFGFRLQAEALTSGAVGMLVTNIAVRQCADHLDSLSVRDCDRLIRTVSERLALPDTQALLLSEERDMFVRTFRAHRDNLGALLAAVDPGPQASPADRARFESVVTLVANSPTAGPEICDRSAEIAAGYFDGALAQVRLPTWERRYPAPAERDSPAARLVFSLMPATYAHLNNRFTQVQALMHVLGVQAAVRQSLLRTGHLPASLDALHLGALGSDPFTGQPLTLNPLADQRCDVSCSCPPDLAEGRKPDSSGRIAMTLPHPYP